jgi:hypothetical protein
VRYESLEQAERELREFQTRRGKIEYRRAACRCPRCRRIFSLLDERLKLGAEGYSAALLAKIEYAGADASTFEKAAASLRRRAGLPIGGMHVQRITERLGGERAEERDGQVEPFKAGQLRPTHAQPPAAFLDRPGVMRLCQEIHRSAGIHRPGRRRPSPPPRSSRKPGPRAGRPAWSARRWPQWNRSRASAGVWRQRPSGRAVGRKRLSPAA